MKLKKNLAALLALSCVSFFSKSAIQNRQNKAESAIPTFATQTTAPALTIRAKSAYLVDYHTGTVLHAQNETKRLPIASMCKIMTLLLSFEALKEGNLHLDEILTVSEKAAAMGGSQVFLEAYGKYPVSELLKSIVVCSANDSCVAIAERLCGSQAAFVEKMNEKAKALQMNDTLFSNCTGLPQDPQYSCAKDVSVMLKELLAYEQYYEFGKVWTDTFRHPQGRITEITNTNKLIRFYDGCDGGKTGFTNEAGFCLAATAKRENTRVISVIIGAENSKNRFDDTRSMFDYAFANYQTNPIAEAGVPLEENYAISGGKEKTIRVMPLQSVYDFSKRGETSDRETEIRIRSLRAPIQKGEEIGEFIVYKNGIAAQKVPLVAAETIEEANYFDRLQEIAQNWNG